MKKKNIYIYIYIYIYILITDVPFDKKKIFKSIDVCLCQSVLGIDMIIIKW